MENNNKPFDWTSQDALLMYILLIFVLASRFYKYLDKLEATVSSSIDVWKIVAIVVLILAAAVIITTILYVKVIKRWIREVKEKIELKKRESVHKNRQSQIE